MVRVNLSKFMEEERRKEKIKMAIVFFLLMGLVIASMSFFFWAIELLVGREIMNIINWVLIFTLWGWYSYDYYKQRKQMETERIIREMMEEHKDEI